MSGEQSEWRQQDVHRFTSGGTHIASGITRDAWTRQGWTCAQLWNGGHDIRIVAHRSTAKRKRLKLDPDLADGCHWTIQDDANRVLMEAIAQWFDEGTPGESITLEIVEMTDREVEELPDI